MNSKPNADLGKLQALVARLRAPDGCPWDREQTLPDLRAYVVEEAHEVAAAIDEGDPGELLGELGDLLFQVVFIAHLCAEEQSFDLREVIDTIHAKMVDRHPHVFGDESLADAAAVRRAWEERKLTREDPRSSLLAGVPRSLPALTAAYRISQKVAGVGFDWSDAGEVIDKIREELHEVEEALERTGAAAAADRVQEEIGDLLFAVANLARFKGLDPEAALAAANRKFRRRFQELEQTFKEGGRSLVDASLEEMDHEWEAVKTRETKGSFPSPEGAGP